MEDAMTGKKTLTFLLMDAPFETARTTTALRLIDVAARRGYAINVFAYEGAVCLPLAAQAKHANAVHGHDAEQEDHPLPREWVAAVMDEAKRNGGSLDWVNCGLCVDERGANDVIAGARRGSPADFWKMAGASDNVLVIPTR
jgi:tRNA 2-thiouridine synthesizing protein D